jgi:hypothetical protein
MPTVTGNLESAINDTKVQGRVSVMLCGYGSRVPRDNGVALVARISDDAISIDPITGRFSFSVPGNDEIVPAGTYYAVTIRDENGDTAQVNAYRFTSNIPTWDLNTIDPFDPNLPPPPLPVPLVNELLVVPAADGMVFDGSQYPTFLVTLPSNVSSSEIENMMPGNLYTFIIIQDGTGGWTFAWPPDVFNATKIDARANIKTIQTFVADENGQLYAIAPGTVMP